MAAYGRLIRLAKQALKENNKEAIEDLKKRLSPGSRGRGPAPGLWEQAVKEHEAENKPAKKAPTKKAKKAKKDE